MRYLKANLYDYQKNLTDEAIAAEILLNRKEEETAGQHFYEYDYERDSNFNPISSTPIKKTTIFVAVGGNTSNHKREVFYFDKSGKFATNPFWIQQRVYDKAPQPKETYPDPSEIKSTDENPEGYLYESSGVGFTLQHEVAHHRANLEGNNNEQNADMSAMDTIRKAWEVWKKSGFTDNSGYYFVFSLPPEKGGGYILTEHKQPNASNSRKT